MFNYQKAEIVAKANEMKFVRDTFEKVLRLTDILDYLNNNPITKDSLALKGGTAINLTIFDLPRLSVDIDLDYTGNISRNEMLLQREQVTTDIKTYMITQNYTLSPKSKSRHSLDSFVFTYKNMGGMNDNIKIEINYSMRCHIFEPVARPIITDLITGSQKVFAVVPMEIFAGKINALLSRAAARDLYYPHNLIKLGLFDDSEYDLLRKCIVFYTAISQEEIPRKCRYEAINTIKYHKIKTELLPVIKKGEFVPLEVMKESVISFIDNLMVLTENEKEFLNLFSRKVYQPELLFDDEKILTRIKNHPMVQWKMQDHNKESIER